MFGEMVFRIIDRNNSDKIDFTEYMIGMWNYCRLDLNTFKYLLAYLKLHLPVWIKLLLRPSPFKFLTQMTAVSRF